MKTKRTKPKKSSYSRLQSQIRDLLAGRQLTLKSFKATLNKKERQVAELKRALENEEHSYESEANSNDRLKVKIMSLEAEVTERKEELRKYQKKQDELLGAHDVTMRSVTQAGSEIMQCKEILTFCADFIEDLENRHLIECHKCNSDEFRWKTIIISQSFEALKRKLNPFFKKRTPLHFIRRTETPTINS